MYYDNLIDILEYLYKTVLIIWFIFSYGKFMTSSLYLNPNTETADNAGSFRISILDSKTPKNMRLRG